MKKRITFSLMILWILSSFVSLGTTYASPITSQQAQQNAMDFLKKKGKTVSKTALRDVSSKDATSKNYYVFNIGNNEGFVIAAADDQVPAILGYSSRGTVLIEAMPDNLKAWLDSYDKQISYIQEQGIKGSTPITSTHAAISPLMTTTWNQTDPYNQSCPDFFSYGKSVTGCVATAMAQVMYYHRNRSVNQIAATIPAYTCKTKWNSDAGTRQISVDAVPAGSVIDWDNMLTNYTGSETAVQKKAIADFMFYCGASVSMDYANARNGGSGAYSSNVPGAMKTYFGYSDNTQLVSRDNYTNDNWDNLIYNELSNHRPVFYSGVTSSNGGHAFVCDGYDSDGYYHINWGWGGYCDTYFLLSDLTPQDQGTGGSSGGYNNNQRAIIGAEPSGNITPPVQQYTVSLPGHTLYYINCYDRNNNLIYSNTEEGMTGGELASFQCDAGSYLKLEIVWSGFAGDSPSTPPTMYINGNSIGNGQTFTINSLSSDIDVTVSLFKISCDIIGNGSVRITKNGSVISNNASIIDGDQITLELLPDAGYRLKKLEEHIPRMEMEVNELNVQNNTYSFSYSWNHFNGDAQFAVEFEEIPSVQKYTVSASSNSGEIHLFDRNGNDISGTSQFDAGSYIRIEPQIPAAMYIKEILVNGVSIGTWNDEDVQSGNSPNDYTIESLSGNMQIEFRTYLYPLYRTLTSVAKGPGTVKMYKNGNYVGTTTNNGANNVISSVFDTGDILKLVFVPDEGCQFKQLLVSEHGSEYGGEKDYTNDVNNNTFTIAFNDLVKDETLINRCFEAYFEGKSNYTINFSWSEESESFGGDIFCYDENDNNLFYAYPEHETFTYEAGKYLRIGFQDYGSTNLSYFFDITINGVSIGGYKGADLELAGFGHSYSYEINSLSSDIDVVITGKRLPVGIGVLAKGPGSVQLYRNGSFASSISGNDEDGSWFDFYKEDALKLQLIPNEGCRLQKVLNGEGSNASFDHESEMDDITSIVQNNTLTSVISRPTGYIVYFEEILPTSYGLTISASGNGSASYSGTSICNNSQTFSVEEGANATITFTPDTGYRIKSVKKDGVDVLSSVVNNQYTVSNITTNTTIAVTFEVESSGVVLNSTNFPDDAFRAYISSITRVDEGGTLTDEELQSVKKIIVPKKGITSLKGIEFFTSITRLYCYDNQLTSLDVSKNTALTELSCWSNQLTSLDVSKNTALTILNCSWNQLSAIDVSNNIALSELDCHDNQLSSLDLSSNTVLSKLVCDDNQLSTLDMSNNISLIRLICQGNQMTSLNISNCTSLTYLACFGNKLSSLDLSNNTSLEALLCSSNELLCIDLSKCTQLSSNASVYLGPHYVSLIAMSIGSNKFRIDVPADFDISKVSEFKVNGISTTPTMNNGKLEFNASYTPQIISYKYDSSNSISGLMDVTINISNIEGGSVILSEANFPDATFRAYISNLTGLAEGGTISYIKLQSIKSIDVSGRYNAIGSITDMKGIEYFTALINLYCYNNQLMSLDVSKNTALTNLYCYAQSVGLKADKVGSSQYQIAVPSDFDLSKVSDFKVNDEIVSPTLSSGYLTFSSSSTPQTINYNYATGYNDKNMDVIINITSIEEPNYDNTIYMDDMEVLSGTEAVLSVKMKNEVVAEGFEFNMYLPEGITVVQDEYGFPEVTLSTERTTSRKTNSFDAIFNADGSLRVLAASTNGSAISGNDGEVVQVKVAIADDMAEGDYTVCFKNIAISDENATSHTSAMTTSTIKVNTYIVGDANIDRKVDVADFTAVAHHLLNNTPQSFHMKAADANTDNRIDVGDLTAIAHLILYGTITKPTNTSGAKPFMMMNGSPADENYIYIEPVSVQGQSEVTLSVKMRNAVEAEGFEFDLYLPEGMSFVTDADGFAEVSLSTERTNSRKTNSFDSVIQEDGSLRVLAASTNGSSINGNDGEVALVTIHIDPNLAAAEYPLLLKNIAIADVNAVSHSTDLKESTITILNIGITTDINGMDNLDDDAEWYTLDGKKLNGNPKAKGVYIMNGKKVRVK